jgi:VWFA-related protein
VPQKIEQLYVEQLPVNVIMVLDTSGSVGGERLTSLQSGASTVVQRLRKSDRAAVLSFSHRLDVKAALTGDREALRKSIAALTADGSTALRDAAYAGLALRAADPTRTLLLIFSDGVDTASILDERRVLEIARRSDATIYGIAARDTPPPRTNSARFGFPVAREAPTDDEFLTKLARETGGRLLEADRNRDIERTFERVLEEFNSRYILGFSPTNSVKGWHRLEVRLKGRKANVLARRGYFAS